MAKASVRGGFHVMWGLFVSTIISAVGAIILALVLGENNYGLYAVVLAAPTLIGLFQDLGVNYAVTRYSARLNAENKAAEIRSIFLSGFIFKTLLGLSLSLFCLLLSPYLAVNCFSSSPYCSINSSGFLHYFGSSSCEHCNCRLHWRGKNAS